MTEIPKFSSRRFELILYLEKEEVKSICQKEKNIESYCFIRHDKDFNEDGSPKEPHIHLVLSTKYPYLSTTIYNKFKVDERNVRIINVLDLKDRLEYQIHKNHQHKYQYDISEVTTNNNDWYQLIKTDDMLLEFDRTTQAVMDMADGMSIYELLKKYGHLFIINFNAISSVASEIKYDKLIEKLEEEGIYDDEI